MDEPSLQCFGRENYIKNGCFTKGERVKDIHYNMSVEKSRFYYRLGSFLKIVGYGIIIAGVVWMCFKQAISKDDIQPVGTHTSHHTVSAP